MDWTILFILLIKTLQISLLWFQKFASLFSFWYKRNRSWKCLVNLSDEIETLSKQGRQRQRRRQEKIFICNPRISLSISLLWLPCMFLFPLKFRWLQRLLLNETMDVSSRNVGHVPKTAWKWSSWSLIWEPDGTNVSLISHIHVRFLSCTISLVVLPTLPSPSPSPSSDVLF